MHWLRKMSRNLNPLFYAVPWLHPHIFQLLLFLLPNPEERDRGVEARGNKIPGVILHRCTATRSSLCKNHFLPKVIYPSSRGLFAWGYLHLWRPVISGYHLGACRIYFNFCLPSAAVSFPGRREARRILDSKSMRHPGVRCSPHVCTSEIFDVI